MWVGRVSPLRAVRTLKTYANATTLAAGRGLPALPTWAVGRVSPLRAVRTLKTYANATTLAAGRGLPALPTWAVGRVSPLRAALGQTHDGAQRTDAPYLSCLSRFHFFQLSTTNS
jgi:hypothetical protein